MEEPIRFDVYAVILPELRGEAVKGLNESDIYQNEFEVRKAVMKSCSSSRHIQVARSLTWSEANQFKKRVSWCNQFHFCQEGYWLDDKITYCYKHNLYYGGILGCHVCNGFYQD